MSTCGLLLLIGAGAVAALLFAYRRRPFARRSVPSYLVEPPRPALRGRHLFTDDLKLEVARGDRSGRAACLLIARFVEEPRSEEDAETRARQLSEVLTATLRSIDLRYRIGVNEFAVIMPETRADGALVATRRIMRALPEAGLGQIVGGVAETGPGIAQGELFRHAYCALLAARREPRAAVLPYSPELDPASAPSPPPEGHSEATPA